MVESESSIRRAAAEFDAALESGDRDRVVACFAAGYSIGLLGLRLHGHAGLLRWLDWVFGHVASIEFAPRLISVDGDTFVEEFGGRGLPTDGRRLESQWAEILTYRDDLVTSLRPYFNPLDFAPALGRIGRVVGPTAIRMARRGLDPVDPIAAVE